MLEVFQSTMPKRRSDSSTVKNNNDPLDIAGKIFIKEEKVNKIKNESLDLDIDIIPDPDTQLEIEDFRNDHSVIDPEDIPGIKKIVNIEDILKNNLDSIDSTNLINSSNANEILQSTESSLKNDSLVTRNSKSICNCMQQLQYYCTACKLLLEYKSDNPECSVCKSALNLKLECSKCKKRFKILYCTSNHLLKSSKCLNLPSNKEKADEVEKEENLSCSLCLFKTDNKELFDLHVKSHIVVKNDKHNEHERRDKEDKDDDFIELYCSKCSESNKPLYYNKVGRYSCKECQERMLYQCIFCKKLYKVLQHIRSHVKVNCMNRIEHFKFHCDHCRFKHEDKLELESHINAMHTPQTCEYCNKEFVNFAARKQHITKGCPVEKINRKLKPIPTESTLPIPLYEEGSYEIVGNHPDILYDEISSKPPKDLYYSQGWQSMIDYFCILCDTETSKKFSKNPPWCTTCKLQFEYRCKVCKKIYTCYSNIENHVKNECPARYSLQCSKCEFISGQKKSLITHIRNKHTVFKCLQCKTKYLGYWCLREHLSSNLKCQIRSNKHSMKLIAFQCRQCWQRVVDVENLSLKPCKECKIKMNYVCRKCDKLFGDLEGVYKHIRSECNRQFYCGICDYRSYNESEFNNHIKSAHANDKTCPDCGVQFRDEEIFQIHRKVEKQKEEQKKTLGKKGTKRIKISK